MESHKTIKNGVIVIVICVFLLQSELLNATNVLPTHFNSGFLGVEWGAPPQALAQEAILINEGIDEKGVLVQIYRRRNETKILDGMSIYAISFEFDNRKFVSANIYYKKADFNLLEEALNKKYGENLDKGKDFILWSVGHCGIYLSRDEGDHIILHVTRFPEQVEGIH